MALKGHFGGEKYPFKEKNTPRWREQNDIRNPKTGVLVRVESKKLPFFKVGKELMERVDY